MAKIDMMWLNDGMHGRADKTSRTYVKGDKVTGRTYAVTLRNPVYGKDFKNGQIRQNNKFGALNMGIAAWYNMAKAANADAADKAQLEKFQKAVKAQSHYPTVRALIMGKRYATVNDELNAVTISDGTYTKTVEIVFNARPIVEGNDDPEFSGSTDSGNSGSTGGSNAETVRLTVSAGNGGKVKIGDGEYGAGANTDVAPGTSVNISAQPNAGYTFSQWSDGNTSASRSVAVNAAMTLTASFTLNSGGSGDGEGAGE